MAVSRPSTPSPPPLEIEKTIASLNRSRKFDEAVNALSRLTPEQARQPAYRFVRAALLVKTNDASAAIPLLEGLEHQLPELLPDIATLRARAQLQTPNALVGAAWLADHGQRDIWLDAARTLARLEQWDAARSAIERGLIAVKSSAGSRSRALIANYRALRAEVFDKLGQTSNALDDLRWLAIEAPTHTGALPLRTRALEAGTISLEAGQRRERLRRLADAGAVALLDEELVRLQQRNANQLSPALVAYLRGRARQVARVDQVEGAKLLSRAADLHIDDATRIRIDAARLWVREGQLDDAVRTYDRIAQLDPARVEEAQFYAARALAILGEPRRAVARYANLIDRFPKGRWRKSAELERAFLWLALNDYVSAEKKLMQLSADANYREQRPQLLELAGLAASLLGRKASAIERWQTVVEESPLSLAAGFAAARLQQVAAVTPAAADADLERPSQADPATPAVANTDLERLGQAYPATPAALLPTPSAANATQVTALPPPSIASASPPSAADADLAPLSRRIDQMIRFGLDEMAAEALRQEESVLRKSTSPGAAELACRAWARVGYGERGFQWSRSIRDTVDLTQPLVAAERWRWECRFPRPYLAMVEEFESAYRLPTYLLSAVMRQESSFDPHIVSPADAVGLLQLLPQTARRVAEEIQFAGAIQLDEPRTNLRLGAAYLRKLLDLFSGNLVLAVAAYNAGPQAVQLWHSHAESSTVELFAARIPYAETQKYVERVLGNLVVYRHLNGSGPDFAGLSLSLPKELKVSGSLY